MSRQVDSSVLKPGDLILNKYQIVKVIGAGGMGAVYLAQDIVLTTTLWAIKVIDKQSKTPDEIEKALDEAALLSKLNNNHIPRITTIHNTPNERYIYIVQDFISGMTLNQGIANKAREAREKKGIMDLYIQRQLSIRRIKRLAHQIIDIFIYLHTRKPPILYRDLKPANLMIDQEDNVKLIDFGIAFEMTPENMMPGKIVAMGTKGYAAPEQFDTRLYHTLQTDIFTFGRLLYELTTGFNPAREQIGKDGKMHPINLPPVRELRPDVDEALEEIIYKCMADSLEERYKSFTEVKYAFDHYKELGPSFRDAAMKQIKIFVSMGLVSITLLGSSATLFAIEHHNAKVQYSNLLAKVDVYNNASDVVHVIKLNPTEIKPFNRLIEIYERDGKFTLDEEQQFTSLITKNITSLKDQKGYGDLAYNVGLMYALYYQASKDENENKNIKLAQSTQWFKDAIDYKTKNINSARIYLGVGQFSRDIVTKVKQGEDKGLYSEYFNNLDKLTSQVDSKTPDMVRLELVDIIFTALDDYGDNIKDDGISTDQIKSLISKANNILTKTQAKSEVNTKTKTELLVEYDKLNQRY